MTPSFSANLDRKIFRCFGCNIHGNAVQLYAQWKKISYESAIEELQHGAVVRDTAQIRVRNIALSFTQRCKLYQIFYQNLVDDGPGLTYLQQKRGISADVARRLGVRFVPPDSHLREFASTLLKACPYDWWFNAGFFDERHRFVYSEHPIIFPFFHHYHRS